MTSVAVGYCTDGDTTHEFTASLFAAATTDAHDRQLLSPGLLTVVGGPRLHYLRNQLCRLFLTTECEWLLCVDCDMQFGLADIYTLVDAADPDKAPIVGGLCFGSGRGAGAIYPTIFVERPEDGNLGALVRYPRDELVPCEATGWAFLLVHRSVLEAMRQPWPNGYGTTPQGEPSCQPWHVDGEVNGVPVEGDLTFCLRARSMGFPIHVHTGARIGHKKTQILTESFYDQVLAAQEA